MTDEIRDDFENIEDGANVILHPRADNPLHKRPVKAMLSGGYFFCEGSNPIDGPDYYFGDVLTFNEGYTKGEDHGE